MENIQNHYTQPSPELRPLEDYLNKIPHQDLTPDDYQKEVILELQHVYNYVLKINTDNHKNYFQRLLASSNTKKKRTSSLQRGLYIWGGVGRGKTYLVNLFFKHLPIEKKIRLHFYRFMQLIHEELSDLNNTVDPLKVVAKKWADKAILLYLDEVVVNDITDAMILGKLLEHLFDFGVVLVATSNLPPDELYKNGLQRQQFLSTIDLLKRYTKILKIGGNIDYRLKILTKNGVYHINGKQPEITYPLLNEHFNALAGIQLHKQRTDIIINSRLIPVIKWADGVVWFKFDELCSTPRSSIDYIQIARFFNTVIISDIPVMDSSMEDVVRRFIIMIDTFYEYHVNLVVTARTKPEKLYTATKLAFEFKRTVSRLYDMQSNEYIARHHSKHLINGGIKNASQK